MTPLAWSLTFGGTCLVAAVVISVACLRMFAREQAEDAGYAAQRTEGMGDPLSVDPAVWAPNAAMWGESATPIYDQLAAENLRAELDDDTAVARWLGASS